MTGHRYEPRSPLQAIDPKAFFGLFFEPPEIGNVEQEAYTVVTIRGPLTQHAGWWEDSYEAIRERVSEACQKIAPVVVLKIDSPGGDVSGCFDTARSIRSMCDVAGKQLVTHVEGQCCSAAYALASASDRIVISRTAEVGSIGVIAARWDESRAMDNAGYKVSLITSGSRKADGFPCTPMSEAEQAAYQEQIDVFAQEFFNLVSVRRGLKTEDIAAFEAATFIGADAVKRGLADELGSFDHLVASFGAGSVGIMEEKEKEARDALRAIAEDEECSEEERARAKRALAALDGEEEPEAQDEEEEPEAQDEEESPDDGEESPDEDEKALSTSLGVFAARMEKRVHLLERQAEKKALKQAIADHGGVPKGLAKILMKKPLAEVQEILASIEKPKKPKLGDHAATATVGGTRGSGSDGSSRLPPDLARAQRVAMGLEKTEIGVVNRGNVQFLGAPMDKEVH